MSYINKKTRVFRDAGDSANEIVRKRSEGRLKAYPSAIDARSWCIINEDRRQHILDLLKVRDLKGLALGKYIPIEVLIDTLLANKDADIKRLKNQLDELQGLLDIYGKLNLTPEQKKQLESMKKKMGRLSSPGEKNALQGKKKLKTLPDGTQVYEGGVMVLPDGSVVYDNDDGGRRKKRVLPDGRVVYESDEDNAPWKNKGGKKLQDGTVVYDNDDGGRRKKRVLPDGSVVYESVVQIGSPKKKGALTLPDGSTVYDNDDGGRRKKRVLPDGTVVYESDEENAPWKKRGGRKLPDGTVVYDDDDGGRRKKRVLPDGTVVYESDIKFADLAKPGGKKLPDGTTVYDDDDGGRRKKRVLPDGSVVYESVVQIGSPKKKGAMKLPDGSTVYDNDDGGRRTKRVLPDGTVVYESDEENAPWKQRGGRKLPDGTVVYDDDDGGRRKKRVLPDGTVVYESDIQFADLKKLDGRTLPDGTVVYDDDDGGRRKKRVLPDGTVVYESEVEFPAWKAKGGRKLGDGTIVYDDDDGGRRTMRILPDGTVVYMSDEEECICDEEDEEEEDEMVDACVEAACLADENSEQLSPVKPSDGVPGSRSPSIGSARSPSGESPNKGSGVSPAPDRRSSSRSPSIGSARSPSGGSPSKGSGISPAPDRRSSSQSPSIGSARSPSVGSPDSPRSPSIGSAKSPTGKHVSIGRSGSPEKGSPSDGSSRTSRESGSSARGVEVVEPIKEQIVKEDKLQISPAEKTKEAARDNFKQDSCSSDPKGKTSVHVGDSYAELCPCEESGDVCECVGDEIDTRNDQEVRHMRVEKLPEGGSFFSETSNYCDCNEAPLPTIDVDALIAQKDEEISQLKNAMAALIIIDRRNVEMDKSVVELQQKAQQQVQQLQRELCAERQNYQVLQRYFEMGKNQNSELASRICEQNKALSRLQLERDDLKRKQASHECKMRSLTRMIKEEKERNRILSMKLIKEKNSNQNLKVLLKTETETRKRESKEAENLRLQLDRIISSDVMVKRQQESQKMFQYGFSCGSVCPISPSGRIRGGGCWQNPNHLSLTAERPLTSVSFCAPSAVQEEESSTVMEWNSKTSLTMWL